MGNRCGCGCIRCRAHTCFVRVQTALHAVHDAAAGEAAHHGLEVKCVAEDRREHTRYIPDVQADNEQRNQYIQDTHERNKDFGDACQTLCAAEYHYAEQERQNDTDERRRDNRMVELEHRERGLQIVRRQHVIADCIDQDDEYREDDTQPALAECIAHVVRRTAVAAAVRCTLFVNLRERRLDEGGCTAEQCGYPHPEDSARSAEADCRGYTDDVARADTRRGGDHECAERGNAPLAFRLLHDDLARVPEQTNLDESASEREVNAADYQKQRHKPRLIQYTRYRCDNGVDRFQHNFYSLSKVLPLPVVVNR